MQTIISQLPPPILTSQVVPLVTIGANIPSTYTVPPIMHGGSVPSTHIVPLGMPTGSGPYTYGAPPVTHGGNGPSTLTIPLTILGDSGLSTTVPQVTLVMHVHQVPINPTTIAGPSHINLASNLPFMACINLPDLAQLTNDPIFHQTFWPPMPTKLPSDIPKFEGKVGECPQSHIMSFHLWCSSNKIIDDSIRLRLFPTPCPSQPV